MDTSSVPLNHPFQDWQECCCVLTRFISLLSTVAHQLLLCKYNSSDVNCSLLIWVIAQYLHWGLRYQKQWNNYLKDNNYIILTSIFKKRPVIKFVIPRAPPALPPQMSLCSFLFLLLGILLLISPCTDVRGKVWERN